MARKRKVTKRSRSRRRRVSGIMPKKDDLMQVVGVAGGLVVASMVSDQLPATMDDKTKSAVSLVAGALLLGQKNSLIRGAAMGLASVGAYKLINSLLPADSKLPAIGNNVRYLTFNNPVSGFNNYPNNPQLNTISGFNNYPNNPQRNTIAGVNPIKTMAAGL